jgi:hypothetical protein
MVVISTRRPQTLAVESQSNSQYDSRASGAASSASGLLKLDDVRPAGLG